MNIRKYSLISLAVFFLGGAFLLCILTRYEYEDYIVENCTADGVDFNVQLLGGFSQSEPTRRRAPYYLRFEVESLGEIKNIHPGQLYLKAINSSDSYSIFLSNNTNDAPGIFLVENINIPYDEYILQGVVILLGESGAKNEIFFECKVKRSFSTEYRIRFIDNLLSV